MSYKHTYYLSILLILFGLCNNSLSAQKLSLHETCGGDEIKEIRNDKGVLKFAVLFKQRIDNAESINFFLDRNCNIEVTSTDISENSGKCITFEIKLTDKPDWANYKEIFIKSDKKPIPIKLKYLEGQIMLNGTEADDVLPVSDKDDLSFELRIGHTEKIKNVKMYLEKEDRSRRNVSYGRVETKNPWKVNVKTDIQEGENEFVAELETKTMSRIIRIKIKKKLELKLERLIDNDYEVAGCIKLTNNNISVDHSLTLDVINPLDIQTVDFKVCKNNDCSDEFDAIQGFSNLERHFQEDFKGGDSKSKQYIGFELPNDEGWNKLKLTLTYENGSIEERYIDICEEKCTDCEEYIMVGAVVINKKGLEYQIKEAIKKRDLKNPCLLDIRGNSNDLAITLGFNCDGIITGQGGYGLGRAYDKQVNDLVNLVFGEVANAVNDYRTKMGKKLGFSPLSSGVKIEGWAVGLTDGYPFTIGGESYPLVPSFEYSVYAVPGVLNVTTLPSISSLKGIAKTTTQGNAINSNEILGAYRGYFLAKEASDVLEINNIKNDGEPLKDEIRVLSKQHTELGGAYRGSILHVKIRIKRPKTLKKD